MRRRELTVTCAVVGAVALGLVGCTTTPSTTSASSAAAPSASPKVRSGPTTGDVIVQGTLRGADPGAGPATVRVVLWPREDDSEVGEAVELWQSEPVTVDASGRWAVEVDPSAVPASFIAPDQRLVNFDVMVESGSTGAQWSTTAARLDDDVWRSGGGTVAERVIDVSMDLTTLQVTLTDSQGEATTSPLTIGTFGPPAD